MQEIGAADRVGERTQAERCEQLADLVRDEAHVRLDRLGRRGVLRTKLRTLCRNPDRACVEVAGPNHEASLGEQHGCPERDLVRAEQRRKHDVTSRLHSAVDTKTHAAAQSALDEHSLCLGQAQLPRRPGVLDRRQRARTRPAVGSGDVDHVGERLRDAGCDETDP